MKKGLLLLTILLSMNFIISCFIADCPEPSQYYLIDIASKAFDGTDTTASSYELADRNYTDTLKHQLTFESTLYVEFANFLKKSNNSDWLNVAYGCVDSEILNPIDPTRSSFSTNQPISFSNATTTYEEITPLTNLLTDERIKNWIVFPNDLNIEQDAITIIDLNNELLFANDLHEFYFKWETYNGEVMRDTVSVFLKF